MYNMAFYDQLEESRRHLFGNSGEPPDRLTYARYMTPQTDFNTAVRNILWVLGYHDENYDFYITDDGIVMVGYDSPETRDAAAELAAYYDELDGTRLFLKTESPDG